MDYRDRLIIKPGHKLRLKDIDPAFKGHHENHESALQELEHYRQKLGQMQALMGRCARFSNTGSMNFDVLNVVSGTASGVFSRDASLFVSSRVCIMHAR